MTESALYACDRSGLPERSEIWGGVRGGVLGPGPDDGKRSERRSLSEASVQVCSSAASYGEGFGGGYRPQPQMTESAL